MVGIKTLLFALGITGLAAAPTAQLEDRANKVVTSSSTGTYNGYYYSNYVESGSDTLTLGTGTYSLKWSSSNTDVVSGIGWATGSAR